MEVNISLPLIAIGTKKWVKFFESTGRKHRNFLKKFFFIGVILGGLLSVVAFIYLLSSIKYVVDTGRSAIGIVLPGMNLPGTRIKLPVFMGLLIIFIILVFHESFHALAAAANNFKIKSFQFVLFLVIPGAGVELDDKELEKRRDLGALEVFAAGSFANILLAALFFSALFLTAKASPYFVQPAGLVIINSTNPNFTAAPGEVITAVNATPVKGLDDLKEFLEKCRPGDWINITTNRTTYLVKLLNVSGRPMIGVYLRSHVIKKSPFAGVYLWAAKFFFLAYLLNLGVAMVNMLPVPLLDGWHFWKRIIKNRKLFSALAVFTTSLIFFNLLYPPARQHLFSLVLKKLP